MDIHLPSDDETDVEDVLHLLLDGIIPIVLAGASHFSNGDNEVGKAVNSEILQDLLSSDDEIKLGSDQYMIRVALWDGPKVFRYSSIEDAKADRLNISFLISDEGKKLFPRRKIKSFRQRVNIGPKYFMNSEDFS